MPYFRKRTYKRKFYPRRRYKTKYMNTASKALKVAYRVKRMLNVEYKYSDTAISAVLPAYDLPSLTLLNGIAQGDGAQSRDGDSVKIVSVHGKLNIKNVAPTSQLRIMIFVDWQTNKANPASDAFYEQTLSPTDIQAFRNLEYNKRFTTLYDKVIRVYDDSPNKNWVFNKKITIKPRYSGTGNSVTDIQTGSLFCLMISDQQAIGTPPAVNGFFRIRYIDN